MAFSDQANDRTFFIFSECYRVMHCFWFDSCFTPNFSYVGAVNHKCLADGGGCECYAALVLQKIVDQ
jgi:hypothetical protein